MCMTAITRERTRCFVNTTMTELAVDYFEALWSYDKYNCTDYDDSLSIYELDTNNVVHTVDFNFTGDISKLNTSQINFPNEIWIVLPAWEIIVKSLLFLPVVIGGIITNIVLFHVMIYNRSMHTPTNILIGMIGIIDILTLLICPWMYLVHNFFQNYMLGSIGCKLEGFLSASLLVIGVFLLSAVSCDRLMAIVLPREARLTKHGAARLSLIIIFIGIIFALPLCIYRKYKERQWKNFLETYCSENMKILPTYWHVLLSSLVLFPIAVMIICYSAIFWKLDKYEKEILRREHPITVNYKMRVVKTLVIVLVTFILCRLPFTIVTFWRNKFLREGDVNSVQEAFRILWLLSHYLIYLNCAINPLIYGLSNESYRRALNSTPIYKWISGNTKNHKEEPKKQRKAGNDNLIEEKQLFNYQKFNKKQDESIKNLEVQSLSCAVQKRGYSQKVVCSRITPLSEDHI